MADSHTVGAELQISVLGPVQTRVGGRPVALSHGLRTTLLAWLALNAGQRVSVDATVGVLWPGADLPPARARLASVLSGLRRALRPAELDVGRHGRQLQVMLEPGAVDAVRLDRSLREARDALARNSARRAVAPLEAAVAAWRGDPYPELLHSADGLAAATRLRGVRADALELLHGVRLVNGHDPAIVAEISALTDTEPLRELSWRQLMAALFRAGRQVEALRAFQACRAALTSAGRTPSAATLELERVLLDQREPPPDLLLPGGGRVAHHR